MTEASVEVHARGREITVTVFEPARGDLRTGIGTTVSPERARQLAGELLAAAGDAERGRPYRLSGTTPEGNRFDTTALGETMTDALSGFARERPGWMVTSVEPIYAAERGRIRAT